MKHKGLFFIVVVGDEKEWGNHGSPENGGEKGVKKLYKNKNSSSD